ncbi:hypothetical protein ITP53_08070 [Nonomuraea sp. K274]|uniref:Uncharacterized protein n=1 Tax=Nonomuraea cypriaca TaxID=1187855 RepID=A0A931A6P2_9ACTN|nr:hypothetical protein [Nonomuraea cypriaca]MBF8185694.1 hypothetical protein [Nonomuraea cypriaca]
MTRKLIETPQISQAREPIHHKVAAAHEKALSEIRALLAARGIHSCVVEWLKLTLHSGDFAASASSSLERYEPELLVFVPQGRRVATVRVVSRSGAYVVEVAQVGEGGAVTPDQWHTVPSGDPEQVAVLIPGYLSSM